MTSTPVFRTTIFSKRLVVAAAVAAISIALTGAPMPVPAFAGSTVEPAKVDICNTTRPAGVWFPPQVESQFAAQCSARTIKLAAPIKTYCTTAIAEHGWVPPQVELQFKDWCE